MSKCFSEPFCSPSPHQAGDAIHGTYFPHIDGLRTFAVLAVVLYHCRKGSALEAMQAWTSSLSSPDI